MARRPPPSPQLAILTPEQMRQGIQRLERRIAEVEAFDPQSIQTHDDTSKAEAWPPAHSEIVRVGASLTYSEPRNKAVTGYPSQASAANS
jgi:hypothetical protein